MTIYIILYILISFSIFIPKNKLLFIFLYIVLFFIGGMRGIDVGTDTSNYYDIYNTINSDPNGIDYALAFIEPGWIFLNYICGILFNDYRSIIFIGMFLAITPLLIRVWKSSKNPFLVIFYYVTLYFYIYSFNITRQMIAVSIILFCLDYLEKNKIKQYVIGVFCAMLFHYTSIICLFHIYIVKKVNISIKNATIILCFTYILGLYIIPVLIPSIPLVGHYSAYIIDAQTSGSITRVLLNAFFIFILACCNNAKVKPYLCLFFVGIVIYNLFAYSSAVGRLAIYFTCTQLFLLEKLNSAYTFNKYTLKLFSYIYATAYFYIMLNNNSGEIIPYQIWE